MYAFAVLKEDGSVVSWGIPHTAVTVAMSVLSFPPASRMFPIRLRCAQRRRFSRYLGALILGR